MVSILNIFFSLTILIFLEKGKSSLINYYHKKISPALKRKIAMKIDYVQNLHLIDLCLNT